MKERNINIFFINLNRFQIDEISLSFSSNKINNSISKSFDFLFIRVSIILLNFNERFLVELKLIYLN